VSNLWRRLLPPRASNPLLLANAMTSSLVFGPEARHSLAVAITSPRVLPQEDAPLPIGRPSPERERGAGAGAGGTAASSTAGFIRLFDTSVTSLMAASICQRGPLTSSFLQQSIFYIAELHYFVFAFHRTGPSVFVQVCYPWRSISWMPALLKLRHPIYNDIPAARQK